MEPLSGILGGLLAIILLTCFVKLATTLTIFRYGIGLTQASFGLVTLALALVLSLFVMENQFKDLGGVGALIRGEYGKSVNLEERFTPFLIKHGDQALREKFAGMAASAAAPAVAPVPPPQSSEAAKEPVSVAPVGKPAVPTFNATLAAFLITELREAFELGLVILIPFLVIDLLIANALALLGITQLSADLVALPLKLLLFVAVDGWGMISEKLIRVYFQT